MRRSAVRHSVTFHPVMVWFGPPRCPSKGVLVMVPTCTWFSQSVTLALST